MKRKLVFGLLALMLVAVPLFSACGEPETTTTPSLKPAPTTTTAPSPEQQESFQLKFSNFNPIGDDQSIICEWWIEEVEARTDGRVTVDYYPLQELGQYADYPEMLQGGVHDIAILPAFRYATLGIFELPYVATGSPISMDSIYHVYYKGLLKDLEEYKILWFQPAGTVFLFLRDKQPNSAADLDGLKIRVLAGARLEFANAIGATAVTLATSEVYMSLERGIIDGTMTGEPWVYSVNLWEVADYVCSQPICGGIPPIVMNLDVWNSLPADIQLIMEQLNFEARYRYPLRSHDDEYADLKAAGFELYDLSSDEAARWKEQGASVTEKMVADVDTQGLPGTEILETIRWVEQLYK